MSVITSSTYIPVKKSLLLLPRLFLQTVIRLNTSVHHRSLNMSKSRLPLYLGLGVAGVGGYYLYSAGGDPKVAQKKAERMRPMLPRKCCCSKANKNLPDDVASASSSLKRDLPGSSKEAKKQGEVWAQSAGATLDKTVRIGNQGQNIAHFMRNPIATDS